MDGDATYIDTAWLNAYVAKYMSPARPTATSDVSQFNGDVHRHFIVMARPHTNHGKSRIRVVQVEKCELPKDLRGPPKGTGSSWGMSLRKAGAGPAVACRTSKLNASISFASDEGYC